jgi:hypothetical protein
VTFQLNYIQPTKRRSLSFHQTQSTQVNYLPAEKPAELAAAPAKKEKKEKKAKK